MKVALVFLLVLSGCSDSYRCIDGKVYERLGSTNAWITRGMDCKEFK